MVSSSSQPGGLDWEEMDPQLRTQIKSHVGSRVRQSDLDDFVQDVIVTAWENRGKFDDSRGSQQLESSDRMGAWVHGITQFKLKEYFENLKRNATQSLEYDENILSQIDESSHAPFLGMEQEELRSLVSTCLEQCDQDTISAVLLRLQGNSGTEIADQLKLSKDTVYKRISRFNKKLKELLGDSNSRQPEVVFSSSLSLSQVFADAIRKRTIENCRYGAANSIENFERLFDFISYLEPETVQQLISTRRMISATELTAEEKTYVTDEFLQFTNELLTSEPQQKRLVKHWKRIEFVTPDIAGNLKRMLLIDWV